MSNCKAARCTSLIAMSCRLYYNGLLAINFTNIEIRSSSSIDNITAMMFS